MRSITIHPLAADMLRALNGNGVEWSEAAATSMRLVMDAWKGRIDGYPLPHTDVMVRLLRERGNSAPLKTGGRTPHYLRHSQVDQASEGYRMRTITFKRAVDLGLGVGLQPWINTNGIPPSIRSIDWTEREEALYGIVVTFFPWRHQQPNPSRDRIDVIHTTIAKHISSIITKYGANICQSALADMGVDITQRRLNEIKRSVLPTGRLHLIECLLEIDGRYLTLAPL